MMGVEACTIVVGHRVVEIELETDDRPQSVGLVVRVDGARRWSSEEPGWRDIALGVKNDLFVWSARRLVVVPLKEPEADPHFVDCEEDILLVFHVEKGWLLVCEASVRLVDRWSELSKLELSDAVGEARWNRDRLVIDLHNGECVQVAVIEGQVEALPAN